ncbi:MAG: ATP-dependent zinc protease [Flavobacteriales bacterium]|nr:ATP-dependent zinc protease [Flavobacteriales bacterium]
MNHTLKKSHSTVIGGKEKVDFEEINKMHVLARIDTGAKTSSIHCEKVWVELEGKKKVLCAHLLRKTSQVTRFKKFTVRKVTSSNGISQTRYVVKLKVKIGTEVWLTEFTLSNRDKMSYPVLLGRKLLRKGFLVDVSRNFVLSGEGSPAPN